MSYILIAGSDKLSLSSFTKFVSNYFKNYKIGLMNSLMSIDSINIYIDEFINNFSEGVLSYYAKRMVNKDPLTCLPERLIKTADVIVWFELYSTKPLVLKDCPDGSFKTITENWNTYIEKIG